MTMTSGEVVDDDSTALIIAWTRDVDHTHLQSLRRLMFAVLGQALAELVRGTQVQHLHAFRFLTDPDTTWLFSAANICGALGADVGAVRAFAHQVHTATRRYHFAQQIHTLVPYRLAQPCPYPRARQRLTCTVCGSQFLTLYPQSRTCSPKCKRQLTNERHTAAHLRRMASAATAPQS